MANVIPNTVADFPAAPMHGGKFIQYNIFGNFFEVTAKYRPPIMPIGRGAYGIVWYSFVFVLDIIELIMDNVLGSIGLIAIFILKLYE